MRNPFPFLSALPCLDEEVTSATVIVQDMQSLVDTLGADAIRAEELKAEHAGNPALEELSARFRVLAYSVAAMTYRSQAHLKALTGAASSSATTSAEPGSVQ